MIRLGEKINLGGSGLIDLHSETPAMVARGIEMKVAIFLIPALGEFFRDLKFQIVPLPTVPSFGGALKK